MRVLKTRFSQWVAANLLGIGGYLYFSSTFWVSAAEFGTPGGPGDAFAWLFSIAPILLCFCLLDFVVLLVLIFQTVRGRHPKSLFIWAGVAILWAIAVILNQHMSYNVISSTYA